MSQSNKNNLNALLVINLVGWLASFYSLWDRAKVLAGEVDAKSFCNISETINCSTLNFSKWGSFLGVPMGSWGLLYFSILLIFIFVARIDLSTNEENKSSSNIALIKIAHVIGLIVSIALFGISHFIIQAYCPACILVYISTLVAFFLSLKLGGSESALVSLKKLSGVMWGGLIIVGALNLFAHKLLEQGGEDLAVDSETAKLILEDFKMAKSFEFDLNNTPAKGASNALVKIVEFSDYQCPHCARAASIIPQVLRIFPDNVQLYVKAFPLDSQCNPKIPGAGHALACYGAKFGKCVYKLSVDVAFFKFHEEIFKKQSSLTLRLIEEIAETHSGKSNQDLKQCAESPQTHSEIVAQTEEANRAGLEGTPTFYINGKKFRGGLNLNLFQKIIEYELSLKK